VNLASGMVADGAGRGLRMDCGSSAGRWSAGRRGWGPRHNRGGGVRGWNRVRFRGGISGCGFFGFGVWNGFAREVFVG